MNQHLRAAIFAALLLSSVNVFAQSATPSEGIPLPDPSIVTRDDATAIESNPAGIGFSRTAELGYGFRLPTDELNGVITEGHALFLSLGSKFVGGGFGVQWVRQPALGGEFQTYRKYTLSLGKSFRGFSIGSSIHWFGSADSAELDDLVSAEVGMQLRMREWLGFGLVFRDINTPFVTDNISLPLRIDFGFAIRLFGGRLIIDPAFSTNARDRFVRLSPRIMVEPYDGIRLFANMDYLIDRTPDTVETEFENFGAGVSVSFGASGADLAMQFEKTNLSDNPKLAALGGYVWISPFKQRSILDGRKFIHVDLSRSYSELPQNTFFTSDGPSFRAVLDKIRTAADDETVGGIVFSFGAGRRSWSKAWEIREAIKYARANGKKTLATMPTTGIQQYYIASAAEAVWGTPADTFHLGGLRGRSLTIRKALQTIGVEAQFIRIGDYKSAPEMFLVDEPSDEAKEQKVDYIDAFWNEAIKGISESRGKSTADVTALLNSDGIFPDEALKQGWLDEIVFSDEADLKFQETFGNVPLIKNYPAPKTREERWEQGPRVAILTIEGNIVSGQSGSVPFLGERVVGDESVIQAIEALRRSTRVKAVVVRIDSPGGSAAASDRMYRALRKLAAKKPVVASMSGTAASGGYYVAAGADEIWATPNTVTGSIGIFTGTFNAVKLLTRIGVKQHRVDRGNPVSFSPYHRWSDKELSTLKKSINYLYRLFLNQAASTRPMGPEALDKLARGHVWVGTKAHELKLVDHQGGIHAAIARAEKLAGLEPGEAEVANIPVGSGGFSLNFLKADVAQSPEMQVFRKFIEPMKDAIMVPILYKNGEALMLGDGLYDGSN